MATALPAIRYLAFRHVVPRKVTSRITVSCLHHSSMAFHFDHGHCSRYHLSLLHSFPCAAHGLIIRS